MQALAAPGKTRSAWQRSKLEVHGSLNGRSVIAIVDTGSSFNLVSEQKATSMGLKPNPDTHVEMSLPDGKKVMSPGQVKVPFNFDREEQKYPLLCSILPGATRDLVLGGAFLKATKTMTLYKHRLRKVLCSLTRLSLHLLGAEQDFLGGYINGSECLAVPDTGSDIMAMSLDHAHKLGLKVHSDEGTMIEFLDGSRVLTDGIAHADWQFAPGEAPISCEFHVIKGLPVDAILSNTLLDEFDVFSRYEERIGSAESLESRMVIYGIALVEVCEQTIRSLSDSFLDDITSDNPFTREKVERERARRDEIRDAIAQIPDETLRAAKQDEEHMRKWRWDNLRKRYLEENPTITALPDENGGAGQGDQDGGGTGRVPLATRPNHTGTSRLHRLMVDDSTALQATPQTRTGLKALRGLFR
ncbi:hypothetical protein CKAH01_05234 [Colletotrichum kahawae]|uniref:Uncharacterized protein n=1 Tax=Colletotrichum kahawae TaxID=34407 RepID=A0AAD9YD19_COLKA|nr:hypothetical protein CKAH01_05234 [Colletotrichum kahawae]